MGSTNYAEAVVVAVRGDSGAHSDQVYGRTINDVCDALGVPAGDRRSTVEHAGDLSACLAAVSTPSMFAVKRIIALDTALDAAALKSLTTAATSAGTAVVVTRCGSRSNPKPTGYLTVIDARPPKSDAERRAALTAAEDRTGVHLDSQARVTLLDRLGADGASLDSALIGLGQAAGGARVDASTVTALVDEGASAAPFEFIDSIEAGDIAGSLERLARLAGPSGWAPLRTLGLLRNRWVGAWRIANGAPVPDGYGGRHLANLARRLGPARLSDGVAQIASTEAAIKGGSRLEPQALVEVCVARLARLARTR